MFAKPNGNLMGKFDMDFYNDLQPVKKGSNNQPPQHN